MIANLGSNDLSKSLVYTSLLRDFGYSDLVCNTLRGYCLSDAGGVGQLAQEGFDLALLRLHNNIPKPGTLREVLLESACDAVSTVKGCRPRKTNWSKIVRCSGKDLASRVGRKILHRIHLQARSFLQVADEFGVDVSCVYRQYAQCKNEALYLHNVKNGVEGSPAQHDVSSWMLLFARSVTRHVGILQLPFYLSKINDLFDKEAGEINVQGEVFAGAFYVAGSPDFLSVLNALQESYFVSLEGCFPERRSFSEHFKDRDNRLVKSIAGVRKPGGSIRAIDFLESDNGDYYQFLVFHGDELQAPGVTPFLIREIMEL